MTRKNLLSVSISLLISGSSAIGGLYAPAALAQADHVQTGSSATAPANASDHAGHAKHRGRYNGHADMNATPAEKAVIKDLRRMEMMYRSEDRSQEMSAMYDSVLAKTQNATVRSYIEKRQAHTQRTPADAEKAIASATKQLNDDLAALK
ncbi:MAG: hypothetical protein ABI451_12465 [Dokdonella sp.]